MEGSASNFHICLLRRKIRQVSTPAPARTKNKSAVPEPLPVPNIREGRLSGGREAMNGSNTSSTSTPPSRYPTGIVKNCRELRAEYTRPCISSGIWERINASRFVFITGMNSQPSTAPMHQTGIVRPRARMRFSVLMANRSERQITFTLLFGTGESVTSTLPATFASPVQVLTRASAVSLPPFLDKSIAGRAAL